MTNEIEQSYQEQRRPTWVLTDDERRIILAIKLYRREYGYGPSWTWLRQQTGLDRRELKAVTQRLKRRKLIGWLHQVPHSTYASKRGVAAALQADT